MSMYNLIRKKILLYEINLGSLQNLNVEIWQTGSQFP